MVMGLVYYRRLVPVFVIELSDMYMIARFDDRTDVFGSRSKISGYVISLVVCALFYLNLRLTRLQYAKLYNQTMDLQGWKNLVEKTLPYPVVVLSYSAEPSLKASALNEPEKRQQQRQEQRQQQRQLRSMLESQTQID